MSNPDYPMSIPTRASLRPKLLGHPLTSMIPLLRSHLLLFSFVLVAMGSSLAANPLAYEPFNYSVGPFGNGQPTTAAGLPTASAGGGFTASWFAGGAGSTIVEGLNYPGLETSANALQWGTSVPYQGENLASPILPSASPSFYVSFLYRASSYTANKSGFGLDNGASAGQGYYMGMTSSGVFGVATGLNGSGGVLGTASESISFDTTYFVVIRFDSDGAYYQSGEIWINPAPGAAEPEGSGTFSGNYTVMNKVQTFMILGGSSVITDEVRLGTTWAAVTPANGATPPAAPTGLQVDSSGENSVSLSWNAATGNPISYEVKRSTSSGGASTVIGTTTAPTVTFTDSVTGGATYYYVVSALSGGGESEDSAFISATPTLGPPSAPTDLVATSGDNQVTLSWTAPAIGAPSSYNVQRTTTRGVYAGSITTPGAQTTTVYTDATASNGTTYYYVVSAVNSTGEGVDSTEASALPVVFAGVYEPFDYPIENNLDNGTAATGTGFTGNWNNGVSGWIIEGLTYPDLPVSYNALRSPAGRQSVSLESPLSIGTRWISFIFKTSYGDTGGNINGVYFPNGGTGLWFGFGLGPTSAVQGQLGLGSINTVGTATQGASELVRLGLGTYGDSYLVVMKIEFNTSGSSDTVTVYLDPVANQTTPGVPAAGSYSSFDVGSIAGFGVQVSGGGEITVDELRFAESYASVVAAVTTLPSAPTGLSFTTGLNEVALSWNSATGGTPTGYNIKRSTVLSGVYEIVGTTTEPTLTYLDTVLGGTTYYYSVSAVNNVGESSDSEPVTTDPILAAPVIPTGLSAVAGNAEVTLSWSASEFATSYTIKRSRTSEGSFVVIGTITAPEVTYNDASGLSNGIPYYYVVSATGAGGTEPDSSPVSATPFGPVPLVLRIEPGAGVTWLTEVGPVYQVQWASEDLGPDTLWQDLGESIEGDGAWHTMFDPAGAPHNFHRVLSTK